MKLFILSAIVLTSFAAQAESWKFECGKSMNVTRTVEISPKAPGEDGYTLKATYVTSGVDQTTGTLRAIEMSLVGQTDVTTDERGKDQAIIALLDIKDPKFQVVIEKTKKVGAVVNGAQIDLSDNSQKEFKCTLKSYAK